MTRATKPGESVPDSPAALRISLIYAVLGILWILFSDRIVESIVPPELVTSVQTYKGWAFVAANALLLFALMRREFRRLDRLRTQQREESSQFWAILDSVADAIVVIDEAQRIVQFNPRTAQTFGYSAEEVIGKPLDILMPKRFTVLHREYVRAFGADTSHRMQQNIDRELVAIRRDGSEFPLEVSIARVRHQQEGGTRFIAIMRDISERKAAERNLLRAQQELEARVEERAGALRETNILLQQEIQERHAVENRLQATMLRLETLIEHLQIGVLFVDTTGRVAHANHQFCALFELESVPGALVNLMETEILERIRPIIVGAPDLVHEHQRIEEWLKPRADDEIVLVDGRILLRDYVPILEGGKPIGHMWEYRDITEQQRSEDALQDALQQVNTLYAVGRALIAADNLESLLHAFAEPAMQSRPCNATLFYYDLDEMGTPEALTIAARTESIPGLGSPAGSRYQMADFPLARTLLSKESGVVSIPDVTDHPLIDTELTTLLLKEGIRATAIIPLVTRGRRVGHVGFIWNTPHALEAREQQAYEFLAPQMAALTESRRLFAQTQEAERRYRLMADNIMDMISRHAPDGTFLYVSPSCRRLLGYEPEALIGQPVYPLIHPESVDAVKDSHARLVAAPDVDTLTFRIRRSDGEYIWFETTSHTVGDPETGVVQEILATSRDITERKHVEQALQKARDELEQRVAERTAELIQKNTELNAEVTRRMESERALSDSEAKLRQIISQMPAIVWTTDSSLRLRSAAGGGLSSLRPGEQVHIGQALEDMLHTDDPTHPATRAHLNALAGTPSSYERQIGAFTFEVKVQPLKDATGQTIGCVAVALDVTARKAAEAEIQNLNERLEQRVAERTAQIEAANHELEAFSYSVSHDLRAPLRAIDGFSRILDQEHSAELTGDAHRYLRLVRDNAVRMGQLIDDLLAFSRLGKQSVRKQQVAPTEIVREVLQMMQSELDSRAIEMTIEDLPPCQADPSLLRQVFANLISNALKFTRNRAQARIVVGSMRDNGKRVYFVRDNGVGFDMRYAGKLFGVFQRLHRVEDYEGTGVGLAIVQRIIHRHGGRVWAEGAADQGATFYFTLGEAHDD